MSIEIHASSDREFGRIGFSEEQSDLLNIATEFCLKRSPIEKVRDLMITEKGFDQAVWQEIADLGWLGVAIPEDYEGGVGLSMGEVVPIVEQMGRALMVSPFVPTILAAQVILAAGTNAQKDKYLPKIITGSIATLAVMEAEGHWDLTKCSATATIVDGRVELSGAKSFVSDAFFADIIIISVMCAGKPILLLLERDNIPDKALRRETLIDETKRSYELILDGLTCSESDFLSADRVETALLELQLSKSLLSAAECCGGTQAVIDYTLDYLQTRKQFGKLIGSYQGLKHPIVDAFVSYEQARSHLYSAAHCFNEQGTGEIATRMARVQADRALSYAADRSIQFHGGFGFTYDCDAQLYRRRAAWHAAIYGDAAYHKKKLSSLLF